jgi:hypothetical protein
LFALIHRFSDVFPIGQFRPCNYIKIMSYDYLKNYHAIRVRYLKPNDRLGSRIKLISGRFARDYATVDRDYTTRDCLHDAYNWLTDHGYTVIGQATLDDNTDVLFVAEFEPLREALASPKTECQAYDNHDAMRRELGRKLLPTGF